MFNNEELIMKLTEKVDSAICCGIFAILLSVICIVALLLYMIRKEDL